MSHEGIRIVNAEQADVRTWSMSDACGRSDSEEGAGEEDRRDGRRDRLEGWAPERMGFAWLRNACPCATCHEEREKTGRLPGEAKPKEQTLLMMYEAPVKPLEVTPVGKYALKFKWTDGHESGIYSWEYLRRVCQCEMCIKR